MNEATSIRRKQILVVDDDASVREMLARVLREEGYSVLTASSGGEALATAATHAVDLVLLDLNLPGRDGWNVLENLTADYPLLTIIIITARSNQLFTALGSGVGALLEKPLDFPMLLEIVRRLLAEPASTRLARAEGRPQAFYHKTLPPG